MRDRTLIETLLTPGFLRTDFQPVARLDEAGPNRLWALSAVSRGPEGQRLEDGVVLLGYARRKRAEPLVDRACVTSALHAAARLPNPTQIGIHMYASTIGRDPNLRSTVLVGLARELLPPEQVIIEVIAQRATWYAPTYRRNIDALRAEGIRFAVRGFGEGRSNLDLMSETRPDYVLVSGQLTRGIHHDGYRRKLVEQARALATAVSATPIAVGIQDVRDLNTLTDCGIFLAQGDAICRPLAPDEIASSRIYLGVFPETADAECLTRVA